MAEVLSLVPGGMQQYPFAHLCELIKEVRSAVRKEKNEFYPMCNTIALPTGS
jgi:hypothetical protein